MTFIPNNVPAQWDILLLRGATWPETTITMIRDGATIVPASATLTFHTPDGALALTITASIAMGGEMTIAGLTGAQTAAINWDYANILFRTVETSGNVITDLLAGNCTVVSRGD